LRPFERTFLTHVASFLDLLRLAARTGPLRLQRQERRTPGGSGSQLPARGESPLKRLSRSAVSRSLVVAERTTDGVSADSPGPEIVPERRSAPKERPVVFVALRRLAAPAREKADREEGDDDDDDPQDSAEDAPPFLTTHVRSVRSILFKERLANDEAPRRAPRREATAATPAGSVAVGEQLQTGDGCNSAKFNAWLWMTSRPSPCRVQLQRRSGVSSPRPTTERKTFARTFALG
jgi:hypothetical protein